MDSCPEKLREPRRWQLVQHCGGKVLAFDYFDNEKETAMDYRDMPAGRELDTLMEEADPIDDILEFYHYGLFVPMEQLRFSLGYIFYPVVEFLVSNMIACFLVLFTLIFLVFLMFYF